jgi:hypothetical protein
VDRQGQLALVDACGSRRRQTLRAGLVSPRSTFEFPLQSAKRAVEDRLGEADELHHPATRPSSRRCG